MKNSFPRTVEDFEAGRIEPKDFSHAEHVRIAFEMLRIYSFSEALWHFARGVKLLAEKTDRPGIYHETITVAFLALIAERRFRGEREDWGAFIKANGDLLEKKLIERWYDPPELESEIARMTFCLPARAAKCFPKSAAEAV